MPAVGFAGASNTARNKTTVEAVASMENIEFRGIYGRLYESDKDVATTIREGEDYRAKDNY
jgi:hypothetical protein